MLTLKLCIEDPELREFYRTYVDNHNNHINSVNHPNAGFDLYVPYTHTFVEGTIQTDKLDFRVKTEMITSDGSSTGFFLMPRSSLSNTSLMLSNHVGLVDSGYRGNIIGAFRNLSPDTPYIAEKYTRLIQICHPTLQPFRVEIVDNANNVSTTIRGDGEFGSTGR